MLRLPVLLTAVLSAILSYAAEILTQQAFSTKPFYTDGRWILNDDQVNLTYAGVNWPAHGETMVPEGLQNASVAEMVHKVKSLGMNALVLTVSCEKCSSADQINLIGSDLLSLSKWLMTSWIRRAMAN